jgi:hypothetical protein
MTKIGLGSWALLLGFVLAGCEESPSSGAEAQLDAGEAEAAAAYLIGTRVWVDTTTTSYFHVVRSLEGDTTIDEGRALEIGGSAKLFAVPGLGWFAVGGGEDPTITRYTLSGDDELVEDERISLQPHGVIDLWDTLYPVSRTKMYYPDRDGQQLIIINPETMTIEGTVDLAQTGRAGFLANYGYTAIERDGKLLISVGWFDWSENDEVLGETGLIVLDTETNEVERFDVDDRCGGITQPVVTESGDVYFASSALAAAAHELDRLDTAPCALRILAGEDAFDPDYLRMLSDVTGAALAGEPVPGGGSDIYVRVMNDDLATIEVGAATYDITGQAAWTWARWNVETDEVAAIDALPPATADVMWFNVDGRVYGTQTDEDYAETKLVELLPDGEIEERLTVPGFMHGLAKIR